MPGGFTGHVRDPSNNKPVGLAQHFLRKPKDSQASSSEQKVKQPTQDELRGKPIQSNQSRESFETLDSIAQQKQQHEQNPSSRSNSPSKSPLRSAFDKAKSKFSPSLSKDRDVLPSSEEEYEKMKAKEQEKERRREEYDRLELDRKVRFGQGGWQMGN